MNITSRLKRKIWQRASIAAAGSICVLGVLSGCGPESDAAAGSPQRKADLRSNLQIEGRQTFVFAGAATDGAYTASVRNAGPVAVRLLSRQGETETPIVVLAPGESAVHSFPIGQAALFENSTDTQASLVVLVWGETNVGMRYEPTKAESKAAGK